MRSAPQSPGFTGETSPHHEPPSERGGWAPSHLSLQVPKGVQVQALGQHSPTTSPLALQVGAAGLGSGGNLPGVPAQGAESRDTWGSLLPGGTANPPFPQPPPGVFIFAFATLFSFTFLFAGSQYSLGSGRSGGTPADSRAASCSPIGKGAGWPPPPAALPAAPHSASGTRWRFQSKADCPSTCRSRGLSRALPSVRAACCGRDCAGCRDVRLATPTTLRLRRRRGLAAWSAENCI
ncbi:PREDICTED: interleukin-15 isoform X1 [Hipposideros armiger]|uniref:Interleukin-15 isoform X1 n=1 Tax=Hipposideros armiger TaxID=186990 RepID=A0A8B7SUY2_HIPAR|nr:PREDICTED: interleukin-15 isoform X1 [Hipposideros armiger]